jgi:hypothetical protein
MYRLLFALIALTAALLAGAAPLSAQVTAPQLREVSTLRASLVVTFNGRVLEVCQQGYEGTARFHEVCHQLADVPGQALPDVDFPWSAGTVKEFVAYDGRAYERRNDETLWSDLGLDPAFDPNAPQPSIVEAFFSWPIAATLTELGSASVGGVPVTHYQYWTTDAEFNAANNSSVVTYSQFVSADGLVMKDVLAHHGSFPSLGEGVLEATWTYSDHDGPVVIGAPPAELVRPAE